MTVRFTSFPDGAQTLTLSGAVASLEDGAELEIDRARQIASLRWPDERAAPERLRLSATGPGPDGSVEVWLTSEASEADRTVWPVPDASDLLGSALWVHVGDSGELLGLRLGDPRTQLPPGVLEALSAGPTAEYAIAEDAPHVTEALPNNLGVFTVDHRVATDSVGEEAFTFHGGVLSWKPFVAELQMYARHHRLDFRCERQRGPLWGLLGVEVTCVVTGRYSEITDFAEYAQRRLRLWRDGDVAG